MAIPTHLVRTRPEDPSEAGVQTAIVHQVAKNLADDEMPVLDAGFKIRQLQAADLARYVVRLAHNFTGRRHELPEPKGIGRPPEYGALVRPLARTRKGQFIPATPPDRMETWTENDLEFQATFWDGLVLPDVKVDPDHPTFHVAAIYDPRFRDPWLLACPLRLSGAALRGLYRDRWPVEQIPLAAKQMLGGVRQFVSAVESCQRLPELNLLAGAMVLFYKVPPGHPWLDGAALAAIGFFTYGPQMLLAGVAAADTCGAQVAAAAVGITGLFSYVGAIISSAGTGAIVDRWGWGGGFTLWIVCAGICVLLLLPLWNTRGRKG